MGVLKLSDYEGHRAPRAESAKILGECRDLALHRLLVSFTSMLDRLAAMLLEHADKSTAREEVELYLSARMVVQKHRANIVADFERILRQHVDQGISGKESKAQSAFSSLDPHTLSLVDDAEVEKSLVASNLSGQLESLCRDELLALNQRIGFLLGNDQLESAGNPLSPAAIVRAFKTAVDRVEAASDVKLAVLKEFNQSVIGDINSIYADLNRHLVNLQVLPSLRPIARRTSTSGGRQNTAPGAQPPATANDGAAPGGLESAANALGQEDVFATLQYLLARAHGQPGASPAASRGLDPAFAAAYRATAAPTAGSFSVDGSVLEALTRLQKGESGFVLGSGATLNLPADYSGVNNVLRGLAESSLATQMGQIDAMTMELVSMIFDYIFEDHALPDGIKALLGRLQIPLLKAAMLDKAFFSKKTHPARMLVNKLAEAGVGWSQDQGTEDPLYKKIEAIVYRIQSEFVDQVGLFAIELAELEEFLSDEEKKAEALIEVSAKEMHKRDQAEIARIVATAEIDRQMAVTSALGSFITPDYLVTFLRGRWVVPLQRIWLRDGEESATWKGVLATLNDLLWSVQPKRNPEERRKLVKMLPDLLQRLYASLQDIEWSNEERETFLGQLVGSHAAAVKASLGSAAAVTLAEAAATSAATPAVADGKTSAVAPPASALADGSDIDKDSSTTAAQPLESPKKIAASDDQFLDLASNLPRGTWIEFAQDDGALVSSKLAWISPLRGNYLFTNRQGRQAFSLSREELAERFRTDRARPVEVEPLLDRALSNLMASLAQSPEELEPLPG